MVLPEAGGLRSQMCLLPCFHGACSALRLHLGSSHLYFSFRLTPIQAPARPTTHRCVSLSGAGAFPWHCRERPAQWPGPSRRSARLPTPPLLRDAKQHAQYQ